MLHICPCSPGCVNIKKVREMQEWQLTGQEYRQTIETEVSGWDGRIYWSDNNFFSPGWRKKQDMKPWKFPASWRIFWGCPGPKWAGDSFISTSLGWIEEKSIGNHRCLSQVQDVPPKAFPENIRKPSKTASQTIQTPPAAEKRLFQFHSWGRNCTTLGGWRRVQEKYHEILNGLVCKSTGKHGFKAGGFSSKIWRNSSSNLGVSKPTGADFPKQFSTSEVSSHQQNESKWHVSVFPLIAIAENFLTTTDWSIRID